MSDDDDLPPPDQSTLRVNAWCGEPAAAEAGEAWEGWGLTRVRPDAPRQALAPEREDPTDWRNPAVGWGVVLPDSDADPKDKARGLDAPACIQALLAERGKAFAGRGGAPVFHHVPALRGALLRRYAPDGTHSEPGLSGERGVASNAVPRYLLIVGSPRQIPWHVQYRLQLEAFVGRLDLAPDGLERYVDALLSDWSGSAPVRRTTPVFWAVDHGGRDITRTMRHVIAAKLAREFTNDAEFDMRRGLLAGEDATHDALVRSLTERRPAFVVTTSHGVTVPFDAPDVLGARLGLPLDAAHTLPDVDRLTREWDPAGTVWYSHACCSAGCDGRSSFRGIAPDDSTLGRTLTALEALGPSTAPLPRRLLGGPSPARAFVGHVEPTFEWTLRDPRNSQTVTAPLVRSFYGELHLAERPPIGYALRAWHGTVGAAWRDYASARERLDEQEPVEGEVRRAKLVASDRESLVLLGDPTVRCG